MELLLTPLAPSLAFSWARGSGGSLLAVLLLYYSFPLLLYGLGSRLPLPVDRLKRLPPEVGALLVPYALYWLGAGKLWSLRAAYAGFLKGPGVAVPLMVVVLWPLGVYLPPLVGAGVVLLGSVGAERVVRWARGV